MKDSSSQGEGGRACPQPVNHVEKSYWDPVHTYPNTFETLIEKDHLGDWNREKDCS